MTTTLVERLRRGADAGFEAAALIERQEAVIASLMAALEFYDGTHNSRPSDGPWGVNSTDFGRVAHAALAEAKTHVGE